jgi:hypothetical protein
MRLRHFSRSEVLVAPESCPKSVLPSLYVLYSGHAGHAATPRGSRRLAERRHRQITQPARVGAGANVGWIMESGELTGTGLAHVKELPGGLVRD